MKNQELDRLEAKIRKLADENSKIKKTNRWLGAFVVMIVIAGIYDLIARYFN
jgi:hypothetical protein